MLSAADQAELDELRAHALKTKKALKAVAGQQRIALQLLADLDERIYAFASRQETTATEEAQDHEHHRENAAVC